MAVQLTRLETAAAQVESSFGIIPNSGGTASVAGSNFFQFKKLMLKPNQAMLVDPSKTGSRTRAAGVAGRRDASWSVDAPLRPNGVVGVKCDMDPFFAALLGQTGTVKSGTASITAASNATPIVCTSTNTFVEGDVVTVTGVTGNTAANGVWRIVSVSGSAFTLDGSAGNAAYVSGGTATRVNVQYTLSDGIPSLSIYSFRKDSAGGVGIQQRCAFGSVVNKATFHMNEDIATAQMEGDSVWVADSKSFSAADVTQQAGLSAFPADPGSHVSSGPIIAGFTGRFVLNGVTQAKINDATITVAPANDLPKNYFGTYYPQAPEGDERTVSLAFNVDEDDTAGQQALYQAAQDATQLDGVFQVGKIAGSIVVFVLKGMQLALPESDDQSGRRWIRKFSESMAHGASFTALNELAIWMT